jgi:hypothetical protein
MHTCDLNIQEVEEGVTGVQGQPGLHSKILPQRKAKTAEGPTSKYESLSFSETVCPFICGVIYTYSNS